VTPLYGLTRARLAETLAAAVDRPFRSDQIYRWLYERGVASFADMSDLGKDLRRRLGERFSLALPDVVERHVSADQTAKLLLRLADGTTIEAVEIPDRDRRTLCLSSQAGCALACRFCVTGFWGGGRDLTAGEIVGQVLALRRAMPGAGGREALRGPNPDGSRLNLVFMGMGEPLLNLDALAGALEILFEHLSWRRITVSTAGVVPGLEALASWPQRPQLAISLHAPDDERRSALMPVNRRYPLADLLAVLERFPLAPRQRITFEYLLIDGFNDALADADALTGLLRRLPAKVNLIPINPDPVLDPALRPPSAERVEAFRRRLVGRGLPASTRQRRGDEVSGACGQLRAAGRDPRGFRAGQLSF